MNGWELKWEKATLGGTKTQSKRRMFDWWLKATKGDRTITVGRIEVDRLNTADPASGASRGHYTMVTRLPGVDQATREQLPVATTLSDAHERLGNWFRENLSAWEKPTCTQFRLRGDGYCYCGWGRESHPK